MSTSPHIPSAARLFIQGSWEDGETTSGLHDKYTGTWISEVHAAAAEQVDRALDSLAQAHRRIQLPPHRRAEILKATAHVVEARREKFTDSVIADTGFSRSDANREVARTLDTLAVSSEEARRIHGEVVPLAGYPAGAGRSAFTVFNPVGVVCAITPFNSPLNTVAHKVGPALAAGNAVVLKPAAATPLSATLLIEALLEAGLPAELIALLHGGGRDVGERLLYSPIPAFYAFTGSTGVGEHIRRTVGLRKTQLELGSLSSTIICADADLDQAADLVTNAAFRKAGQVCTSVQRLYVEQAVVEELQQRVTAQLGTKSVGDPWAADTFMGPMINAAEAARVESWVQAAVSSGAQIAAGGTRNGSVVVPTVLTDVPHSSDVFCKEIFGPVMVMRPFQDLEAVIQEANATPYGLSAGIFTNSLDKAFTAARGLHMGSVHINQTSSNRIDAMPYGGVKESGTGVEGPKYAIREMSDQRLITFGPVS